MSQRAKLGVEHFKSGYNCAQAVIAAYEDELKSPESLKKVASSFGGGIGGMREVCGALSGMAMVCGEKFGYDTPEKGELKKAQTAKTKKLCEEFEKTAGALTCKDLLEKQGMFKDGLSCQELVALAIDTLEKNT